MHVTVLQLSLRWEILKNISICRLYVCILLSVGVQIFQKLALILFGSLPLSGEITTYLWVLSSIWSWSRWPCSLLKPSHSGLDEGSCSVSCTTCCKAVCCGIRASRALALSTLTAYRGLAERLAIGPRNSSKLLQKKRINYLITHMKLSHWKFALEN